MIRHKVIVDVKLSFLYLPDLFKYVRDPLSIDTALTPKFFNQEVYHRLECPGAAERNARKRDLPLLLCCAMASLASDQEDGGLEGGLGSFGCGPFVERTGTAVECTQVVAEVMRTLLCA